MLGMNQRISQKHVRIGLLQGPFLEIADDAHIIVDKFGKGAIGQGKQAELLSVSPNRVGQRSVR